MFPIPTSTKTAQPDLLNTWGKTMNTQTDAILEELDRRLDWRNRLDEDRNKLSSEPTEFLLHVPQVFCADGFKMSVQASKYHYCAPRSSVGPWSSVEVGFPSKRVEQFMKFIDGGDDTDPTDTVYGCVPLETVAEVIAEHGGFAEICGGAA